MHCRHLGWTILCRGAVLCLEGCLAASLASTHQMLAAHPHRGCDDRNGLQTLPGVPWRAAPPWLRTPPQRGAVSRCAGGVEFVYGEEKRHKVGPGQGKGEFLYYFSRRGEL